MRVVLDTNILVSSLLAPMGSPALIRSAWLEGNFTLVTCEKQITELRSTLRKPRVAPRIKPHQAGELINQMRAEACMIGWLPRVSRSPDPTDDFLLALCEAGMANYLVTGDKTGLLSLKRHKITRIVSPIAFAFLLV